MAGHCSCFVTQHCSRFIQVASSSWFHFAVKSGKLFKFQGLDLLKDESINISWKSWNKKWGERRELLRIAPFPLGDFAELSTNIWLLPLVASQGILPLRAISRARVPDLRRSAVTASLPNYPDDSNARNSVRSIYSSG